MNNFVSSLGRSIRKSVSSAIALTLIGSFFAFNLSAQTNGRRKNPLKNIKDARSEKGSRVGDRVKQLRATNKAVNAALEAFEKKGHKPKFDEAFSFTGKVEQPRQVTLRKSHHASQQTSVSGDGVEIIFTTVVDLYNEWQGTAIANFYDASGALEEQYVADVVITRSEYNSSQWTANFELKFESDGIGYLNHRPGMFTDFDLGTPIQQQSAPLSLDPSQFASTEQLDQYYDLYPEQYYYDNAGGGNGEGGEGGGGGIQPIQPNQQARLVKRAHAAKPQRCCGTMISPWTFYTITGWGNMAGQVGRGCTATTVGCGVAALLGAPALACAAGTCTAVVVGAAMNNLRIVRR
jgi:hypothetical protein